VTQLTVLTEEEVEAIHQATLHILSEVGIVLTQPEAREVLVGAGATVRDDRVLLPPDLVERGIARCPGQVTIRGRNGQTAVLGDDTLHWHNLGGAREVYDPHTGQRRPATVQDVRDSSRLLDALDGVTTITPFFTPQDVPGPLLSLAMYRHTLPHTTKPVHGPGVQTAIEVCYVARMAAVVSPPDEVLTLGISPVSPLTFPDDVAEAIMETARLGVPLGPLPCPTAGATAPMSLAGALAQQNAEVLASVALAQLLRPGLPMVYCGRLAMMEPGTGVSVWGGVELGLASAATVQIGHRYGLPVNVYGLSTNAHTLDLQSGYERALNAAIPALAGADELSGIGEMEAGVASSYAQMVCDNEIAASVRRLRRGFAVDEDALAVEVIAAVMDGSRNFLDQRHTVRYLRAGEVLYTHLAERRPPFIPPNVGGERGGEWERAGREGMAERAQAEAERLLAEHEVPPLAEDQERELEEIMQEAVQDLA
jgi:trimethylamine--corrinoid protein Co-methyltransferase